MQHSLNIPPHLKRVATLLCETFMSENSLLISEIHLIISLWFSLSTCYDESVIHYASHRTEHARFLK